MPPPHVLLPLIAWQTVPQPPQLLLSFANTDSQPVFTLPSQSPKVVPQLGMHTPAVQVLEPCGAWHTEPQAPQLLLAVFRLTSQPSASGFMLQSAKFAAHLSSWQPLATHLPVALSAAYTVSQLRPFAPQPPQLAVFVLRLVSQSVPFPSQSNQGGVHLLTLHCLATHCAVAFTMLHTLLHAPQLAGSLTMLVSQPFFGSPSQSAWFASHVPTVHTEATQAGELLAVSQAVPHTLQLFGSLPRLTSQPFFGSPSQSPNPAGQSLTPHTPTRCSAACRCPRHTLCRRHRSCWRRCLSSSRSRSRGRRHNLKSQSRRRSGRPMQRTMECRSRPRTTARSRYSCSCRCWCWFRSRCSDRRRNRHKERCKRSPRTSHRCKLQ